MDYAFTFIRGANSTVGRAARLVVFYFVSEVITREKFQMSARKCHFPCCYHVCNRWEVIPPVAGRVGRVAGTDGILYLATGLTAAHVLLFLAMQAVVSSKIKVGSNDTVETETNNNLIAEKT